MIKKFLTSLFLSSPPSVVSYIESSIVAENSTYSEFYSVHICPKCKHILNFEKARYITKCCYLCGHTNGWLFDPKKVVVRDRFINSNYIETIVK